MFELSGIINKIVIGASSWLSALFIFNVWLKNMLLLKLRLSF